MRVSTAWINVVVVVYLSLLVVYPEFLYLVYFTSHQLRKVLSVSLHLSFQETEQSTHTEHKSHTHPAENGPPPPLLLYYACATRDKVLLWSNEKDTMVEINYAKSQWPRPYQLTYLFMYNCS